MNREEVMTHIVTANKGAKTAPMTEPDAIAYAVLLIMLGNYSVRVRKFKRVAS